MAYRNRQVNHSSVMHLALMVGDVSGTPAETNREFVDDKKTGYGHLLYTHVRLFVLQINVSITGKKVECTDQ